MDVIVRSNYSPVNDMTAPVSGFINDLDRVQRLRVVIVCLVSDCQSGYSYHQQGKQILGGCLRDREGQAAVQ